MPVIVPVFLKICLQVNKSLKEAALAGQLLLNKLEYNTPAGTNLQFVPCLQIIFAFAKQGTGHRPAPY